MRATALLLALAVLLGMSVPASALVFAFVSVDEKVNTVLTAEGYDWKITAVTDPQEDWPENLELRAEEADGEEYLAAFSTGDVVFARFFDISLLSEGTEIQPEGRSVVVEILVPELNQPADDIQLVHFSAVTDPLPADPDAADPALQAFPEAEPIRRNTALKSGVKMIADSEIALPSDEAFEFEAEETADGEEAKLLVPEKIEYSVAERDGNKILSFVADGFSVYGIVGTTLEKTVLASDGNEYRITVTFGPDAEIPADAELDVFEVMPFEETYGILYEEYAADVKQTFELEEDGAPYLRLFDIRIVDKEDPGVSYQPAEGAFVEVKIELADAAEERDLHVVHLPDGSADGALVSCTAEPSDCGQTLSFKTDGFSVYAVVDAPEPYVPQIRTVSTLSELSENTAEPFLLSISTGYMTNTLNGSSAFVEDLSVQNASEWFFEPVAGVANRYRIYTVIDGQPMYLKNSSGNLMTLSDANEASRFDVSASSNPDYAGTFILKLETVHTNS